MALDPNKKFLYFNKDETSGESDDALCFPVSSFIGIETQTSARMLFYFEGSKGVDATTVRVSHDQHAYIKTFMSFLVDEINFGEKAFIKVYDHAQRASYPSDISVNMGTDVEPVFDLEDATIDLGTVLSVEYGGTGASTLTADGVLFGNGTSAISAVDLSTNGNVIVGGSTPAAVTGANLAGAGLAATVGNGTLVLAVETLNQDTTGNATTATLAASTSGVVVTDESSDVTCFPLFVTAATGTDLPTKSGSNLTFNSSSGLLTATLLAGDLTGDVTGNADTLATPRAINGVDFDGSAPITVTAAGSTLSDTVTVAKGGTGLTTVAENTMLTGNGTGALTAEANLTYDGTNLQLASDGVSAPDLTLLSTSNHVTGSNFVFKKLRADNTPVDGDIIGTVVFQGEDDNEAAQVYASIIGFSKETGSGEEGGELKFNIATHDGEQQPGLIIEDGSAEDEVDVTIANGAASVTTVAGTLTMGSTAAMTNAGLVSVTAQTNITSLGTLTNLNVDNININTSTIQTGSGNDMNITASGDLNLTATGNDVNVDTDNFKIESAGSHMPYLTLTAVSNTSDGGHIQFKKDRGAAAVNNDIIGTIDWIGENDAQEPTTYGIIIVEALEVDDTDEAGRMIFKVAESNGSVSHQTAGLVIEGSDNATDGEVNVIIAAGAASVTTVAGDLRVNGTDIYGPTDGDLQLRSDGNIALFLDGDGDESSQFQVINDASGPIFTVTEAGVGALNNQTIVTGGKIAVASEAQAPIGMHIARRTITTAEANAMNSTPIELIPAQGANTIIEISNVIARVDRAATQTNSAVDMNLHYADKEPGTYGSASLAHWRRFAYNKTTDIVERRTMAETTSGVTLTEDVNKAVELSFDSATTTNCFTSIDMYVTYYVIDIS